MSQVACAEHSRHHEHRPEDGGRDRLVTERATLLHKLVLIAAPLGCAVLYLFDPSASNNIYPLCPFRAMTGLWCPGCGTLRAGNRLLHGRVGDAIGLNPLAVAMIPVLLYAFVSTALLVLRGRGLPTVKVPAGAVWALAAVLIAFGIVRNIPAAPFTLLAP